MIYISPDGLGSMLNVDMDDEYAVKDVNPYAFGYRVFRVGTDGRYYSPYGYNLVGMDMGETVPSWYMIDENGDIQTGIPEEFSYAVNSYGDLAKHGFVPIRSADEIPFSEGKDEPVADVIRRNYENLPDYKKKAIEAGTLDIECLMDELLANVTTNGEKRGVTISPDYAMKGVLRTNSAPHLGYSIWGIADPRFSILPSSSSTGSNMMAPAKGLFGMDRGNVNVTDRAILDELVKSNLLDESGLRSVKRGIRNRNLIANIGEKVVAGIVEGLSDVLPHKKYRDRLTEILGIERKSYIPYHGYKDGRDGIFSPDRAKPLRIHDYTIPESLSSAIKGKPEDVYEAWDRVMRNSLLRWIRGVLGHKTNRRLVQVMVPLTSLVPNWAAHNVSTQVDSPNELRALEMTLGKDIAGGKEFVEAVEKYNELLRKPGMKAADAWAEAFGDKYGDLHYLNSDRRLKEVEDSMRKEVDDYISRRSILHGLKGVPGDD